MIAKNKYCLFKTNYFSQKKIKFPRKSFIQIEQLEKMIHNMTYNQMQQNPARHNKK